MSALFCPRHLVIVGATVSICGTVYAGCKNGNGRW